MSIFREHKSIADRSAADRQRHKKLIDRAIKDSIKDVIAEESIIMEITKITKGLALAESMMLSPAIKSAKNRSQARETKLGTKRARSDTKLK